MSSTTEDIRAAIARAVATARESVKLKAEAKKSNEDMEGGVPRDPKLTKLGRPKANDLNKKSNQRMKDRATQLNDTKRGANSITHGDYRISKKVAEKGYLQDPKNRKYAIYFQEKAGERFKQLSHEATVNVKGVQKQVNRPRVVTGTPLSAAKKAVGILHKKYSSKIAKYTDSKGKEFNPQRRVSAEALVSHSSEEAPVHFKLVEITKGVRHTSKGKRVSVGASANFVYEFYGWRSTLNKPVTVNYAGGKVVNINHKNVAFRVANINQGKPYDALLANYKKRSATAKARAVARLARH